MDRFLAKLYSRINYERQARVEPQHFKLNNLRALLTRVGNPELSCPVVHVAGTKGKGSVSTMVANILSESGRKTGLFTSPHLIRINQRIAIDGQPISDRDFETILGQLQPQIDAMDLLCQSIRETTSDRRPAGESDEDDTTHIDPKTKLPITGKPLTFFEVMTAAAFLHYANQKCDAVVLEVGLGGRLDSTNVCQPTACVITNISLDHTRQLGSTIDKIAFEKAGIIKPSVPVVSGELKPLAADVIARIAKERDADLILLNRDFSFSHTPADPTAPALDSDSRLSQLSYSGSILLSAGNKKNDEQKKKDSSRRSGLVDSTEPPVRELRDLQLAMLGPHQRCNASIAVATAEVLNCLGWKIDERSIRKGLLKTELAGRTQIVQHNPTVVLDVAHNVASAEVLLATLNDELPAWRTAAKKRLVISISKDKDCQSILEVLLPQFDDVVIAKYQENPRAVEPEHLFELAEEIKQKNKLTTLQLSIVEKPLAAWQCVAKKSSPTDFVCITGSVFLVAELAESFSAGSCCLPATGD
jgi:dihydrofolate synthase/folylpolyglutamate synthase